MSKAHLIVLLVLCCLLLSHCQNQVDVDKDTIVPVEATITLDDSQQVAPEETTADEEALNSQEHKEWLEKEFDFKNTFNDVYDDDEELFVKNQLQTTTKPTLVTIRPTAILIKPQAQQETIHQPQVTTPPVTTSPSPSPPTLDNVVNSQDPTWIKELFSLVKNINVKKPRKNGKIEEDELEFEQQWNELKAKKNK